MRDPRRPEATPIDTDGETAVTAAVPRGVFKALADPSRMAILARLAPLPHGVPVSEVAACCPVDLSVVSRHLKLLREAGLVAAERRGRQVLYRAQIDDLVTLLRQVADALERCCPGGSCTVPDRDSPSQEETEP